MPLHAMERPASTSVFACVPGNNFYMRGLQPLFFSLWLVSILCFKGKKNKNLKKGFLDMTNARGVGAGRTCTDHTCAEQTHSARAHEGNKLQLLKLVPPIASVLPSTWTPRRVLGRRALPTMPACAPPSGLARRPR